MENKVLKLGEGGSTEINQEIPYGETMDWIIESYKKKLVNGKPTGNTSVGFSASISNPSKYLLERDINIDNQVLITPIDSAGGYTGVLNLVQEESGNKININITTPGKKEYWEIRFSPLILFGITMDSFFAADTNISGEYGSMADGTLYKNWIVNQNRNMINVYISPMYPGDYDMLSWSCLDKNGNAFSPNYNLPSNSYFTTKTTGLGSYTLTKVSTPSVSSGTLILSSSFNPTKKYPLDLNFYWGVPT